MAKFLSRVTLNVLTRCGFSPCACQMRLTLLWKMPAAAAMLRTHAPMSRIRMPLVERNMHHPVGSFRIAAGKQLVQKFLLDSHVMRLSFPSSLPQAQNS